MDAKHSSIKPSVSFNILFGSWFLNIIPEYLFGRAKPINTQECDKNLVETTCIGVTLQTDKNVYLWFPLDIPYRWSLLVFGELQTPSKFHSSNIDDQDAPYNNFFI